MDPNNPNFQGNENNLNFDPEFASHPNFQVLMQMMRAIPSNFQHNSSSSNPTPSFHQDISQNFNESQSYHTSLQDSYTDNNSTQPYFGVVGGQGSSNEVLREEDDDVEETHPTTIEPILTPPVVVRSKKKKTPNATTKAAAANMSWSVREEEAVISCYMEHCTDATTGTNQTGAEPWRKVFASYELARQSRPHELPERTPNSIRSRWSRMAKDVLKWVGYLEEVARVKKSGQVDDDIRREAHIMWRRHENCNFIYEKAFESLFLYPKWKTRIRRYLPKSLRDEETNITQESDPDSSGSGKRVRLDEDDEVAVDDDSTGGRAFMSGGIVRPGGVKQAKAKKFKGKATSSCSEEVAMSLGENLKLHAEMRGVDINLQKEKLEFE
ncbi:glutathione S-transferase T2-like [Beta vulgaris subsp. vulgaris]|uniref:glutathione S-transferase T2-like n=1 Tax=Beta vulgaris subsp. vulgaris TaxID=3555 RepID=UPI002036BCE9|nr:glutathione S-transferase T2-like [Beta vulgaris subsp. vulgaris]